MTHPPSWLTAIGRWLLGRRFDVPTVDEIDGDIRELWRARHEAGRRDLRRACVADLAGVLFRRGPAPSAMPPQRHTFLPSLQGAPLMLQDLAYAFRMIRRQPQHAAVTVVTLALGIAAATAIFSTVERLLLRPLPYPDPEALVVVEEPPYSFGGGRMGVSPRLHALGIFSGAGLYAQGGLNIGGDSDPLRVQAAVAEPGFFDAFAVRPALGRAYTRDEDVVGSNTVAVISDALWRRLGADADIVDSHILVNLRPFRVVGVMPSDFRFPGRTDIWIPVASDRQSTGESFIPSVVARLAPGVSLLEAEAALDRFRQEQGSAEDTAGSRQLVPLHDQLTARIRPLMFLLAAAVALLLLVSCSNVASLLLSRVARRRQEFAMRRALGGSRWRLARLLLVESLVLSLVAGAVGTGGALLLLRAIPSLLDQPVAGVDLARIDPVLLLIALAVSIATGLTFGLAPGVAAAAGPASQVVRSDATVTGSRGWRWFRGALVALQVAVALVLLTVTAATAATMLRLARVDLGFGNPRAMGLVVTLPMERYDSPERVMQFYRDAVERLRAVPGVRRVGATGVLPGSVSSGVGLRLTPSGVGPEEAESYPFASMLFGSPDYFGALGIPIIRGRSFLPTDSLSAPRVVILSETAARSIWPDGRDAVGERVEVSGRTPQMYEVVGVVADVRLHGPEREARGQFYRPILQATPFGSIAFVADAEVPPATLVEPLRRAIADVDSSLPLYDVRSLEDVTAGFLTSHRLAMTMMGGFALTTLLLSAVGLYGVLAQLVSQRTRELGIRVALGADGRRLQRGVVLDGLRVATAGVVAGAAAAGLAARLLGRFVPALDPPGWSTVAAHAAVLLVVAVVATWIPARRAARVDPLVALRE